jgi:hypothetical protein
VPDLDYIDGKTTRETAPIDNCTLPIPLHLCP